MRGWMLLLLCTYSVRPGHDINPRYIDRVEEFSRRCGQLCVHYDAAKLKMQPVNFIEMNRLTNNIPGVVGLARVYFLAGIALKYEVYILDTLTGVMEDSTIVHELFHALAGMDHTEQTALSFMAPNTVDAEWYMTHWETLWKNDICALARERGQFLHEACEGI